MRRRGAPAPRDAWDATPASPPQKSPRGAAAPLPRSPRSSPPTDQRYASGRGAASLRSADPRRRSEREADAAASHALGEGLRVQVLQRPARFSVYACDRGFAHKVTGGDNFTVSIRGPSLVYPSLHDAQDGTYTCEWQASVSGLYLISIMLEGDHIAGSPFAARAIAPGADPSQCRIKNESGGKVASVAGEPAAFEVEFFDALGQGVVMEPEELQLVLKSAEAYAVRRASPRAAKVVPSGGIINGLRYQHGRHSPERGGRGGKGGGKGGGGKGAGRGSASGGSSRATASGGDGADGGDGGDGGTSPRSPRSSPKGSPLRSLASPRELAKEARLRETSRDGERIPLHLQVLEASDRTCRASVTVESAGDFELHIVMQPNHVPLQGSPLALHVSSASPAPSRCHVVATDSERRLLAGQHRTFLVRTCDGCGNDCTVGGANLSLDVPDPIDATVTDLGDGSYEVEWTSTISGNYDVLVLVDGKAVVDGAPLQLMVDPAPLCVSKSAAGGDVTRAIAGQPATVALNCVDEFYNPVLPSDELGFGLSLRGKADQEPVPLLFEPEDEGAYGSAGTPHGSLSGAAAGRARPAAAAAAAAAMRQRRLNSGALLAHKETPEGPSPKTSLEGRWTAKGTYELVYTCPTAGAYYLHVWCHDGAGTVRELPDSPHMLRIEPAVPSPAGSFLREGFTPLRLGVLPAGTSLVSLVQIADRFGNPCRPPKGPREPALDIFIDGPEGRRMLAPGGAAGGAGDEALGVEGIYEVRDKPTESGPHRLCATLDGCHLRGSPIKFEVAASGADGEHSILVPPPVAPLAHERCVYLVQARDRWGNAPPPLEVIDAVMAGAVVARADGPTRPKCDVAARDDGTIEVSVVAQLSGDYRLHVWVGGTQLPGSPYPHRVHQNRSTIGTDQKDLGAISTGSTGGGTATGRHASPPRHWGYGAPTSPGSGAARQQGGGSPPSRRSPPSGARSPPTHRSPPGRARSPPERAPAQHHGAATPRAANTSRSVRVGGPATARSATTRATHSPPSPRAMSSRSPAERSAERVLRPAAAEAKAAASAARPDREKNRSPPGSRQAREPGLSAEQRQHIATLRAGEQTTTRTPRDRFDAALSPRAGPPASKPRPARDAAGHRSAPWQTRGELPGARSAGVSAKEVAEKWASGLRREEPRSRSPPSRSPPRSPRGSASSPSLRGETQGERLWDTTPSRYRYQPWVGVGGPHSKIAWGADGSPRSVFARS